MANFNDLSADAKRDLHKLFSELSYTTKNEPYEILAFNKGTTRFFHAVRRTVSSDKLNMAFGGGSFWTISYGEVGVYYKRDLAGDLYGDYGFGRTFGAKNGITIPKTLDTKSEVISLMQSLSIFNI